MADQRLRRFRVRRDHRADDVAAPEAAEQGEARRLAAAVEHHAFRHLQQRGDDRAALHAAGLRVQGRERRRVAAADGADALARPRRHQADGKGRALVLPHGAAGAEAEALVERQARFRRVEQHAPPGTEFFAPGSASRTK